MGIHWTDRHVTYNIEPIEPDDDEASGDDEMRGQVWTENHIEYVTMLIAKELAKQIKPVIRDAFYFAPKKGDVVEWDENGETFAGMVKSRPEYPDDDSDELWVDIQVWQPQKSEAYSLTRPLKLLRPRE